MYEECAINRDSDFVKTGKQLFFRYQLVEEKIDALEYTSVVSGDKRLREHIEMIQGRYHAVIPTDDDNTDLLSAAGDVPKMLILVLVPGDAQYTAWKDFIETDDTYGLFYRNPNLVVLKKHDRMSKLFSGIIFGHELDHAKYSFENGHVAKKTSEMKVKEEVAVHTFELGLVSKAGGKKYHDLVRRTIKKYAHKTIVTKSRLKFPSIDYPKEMDAIFGVSLSKFEEVFRQKAFREDVIFHYLEQIRPKDSDKYKCWYVHEVYKNVKGYEWKPVM